MTQQYWLVKSEPDCFSVNDLAKSPKQTTCWSGVRNYQARNMLRDQMKKGDRVLFYHSSCDPTAVVGICQVVKEGYPDHTQFDAKDDHYDPDSKKEDPRWFMVDLKLDEKFTEPVTLATLRSTKGLEKMELLRKGSRLSVQPVRKEEFELVEKLGLK